MTGMISKGRDRLYHIKQSYVYGFETMDETSEAADQIIDAPDKFLLSQEGLFAAEGSWGTFALTVGFGAATAACLCVAQPKLGSYLLQGQLRGREMLTLVAGAGLGGALGQQIGIRTMGDHQAYKNHWMAYTYVKSMNRYDGKNVLSNAPIMY